MVEHRRSPRARARFWLQILGVDDQLKERRGNISLNGVFFEIGRDPGGVGTVQSIRLSSRQSGDTVDVMARIVRVMRFNDLWDTAETSGVAMEFMAEDVRKRETLHRLVHEIVSVRPRTSSASHPTVHGSGPMALQHIDMQGMVLSTNWAVTPGEIIRCEIHAPKSGQRLHITGEVVAIHPAEKDERYRVEVRFKRRRRSNRQKVSIEGGSLNDAMSVLLEETQASVTAAPMEEEFSQQDLTGSLDRIQIPALLSFMEMERMTGVLELSHGAERAKLWVKHGRLRNAQSTQPAGDPVQLLANLLHWNGGRFHFSVQDIDVPDRINMSTTGLLLELARQGDERDR